MVQSKSFASLFTLLIATGCAAGSAPGGSSNVGGGGVGGSGGRSATTTGPGGSSPASSSSGLGTGAATSSSTGGSAPGVIYSHTNTTLFQVDSTSLSVTQIGDFDCIGNGGDTSMTDVAVDSHGNIWGISKSNVYSLEIQGSSVHCAQKIPLSGAGGAVFYGLSFAPAGVIDPQKEVLVAGNTAGELWAIDDAGHVSQHGTFGAVPTNDGNGHTYPNAGKVWELSGDIVFLSNGGQPVGFATVRDCPHPPDPSNCDQSDTLIQLDLSHLGPGTQSVTQSVRGKITQGTGCSMNDTHAEDFGKLYGIGAWNDKVFGFSNSGALIEIDNNDGSACLVQYFSHDAWAGAGVTTAAPVIVPNPK
ncbi:MAG TPA: hypothetical protein VHB21_24180 [Minicystis sp.]|nr:hypothetical protein [Minicystis sp.]